MKLAYASRAYRSRVYSPIVYRGELEATTVVTIVGKRVTIAGTSHATNRLAGTDTMAYRIAGASLTTHTLEGTPHA